MKVESVGYRHVYETYNQFKIDSFEIIIDFDNDRHHLVNIQQGVTSEQLVTILRTFAVQIERDEHAKPA